MRYSIEELKSLSTEYAKSKQVSPNQYYKKPEEIFPLIHHGDLLGFTPLEALNSFMVINGKMTMWGDALPALALNSGELEKFEETFEGALEDGTLIATCTIKRKGINEKSYSFSLADAEKAGLWSSKGRSKGQWSAYPKRMLQIRARSFSLRNTFADKLGGIIAAEEALDYVLKKKSKGNPEENKAEPVSENTAIKQTVVEQPVKKYTKAVENTPEESTKTEEKKKDEVTEINEYLESTDFYGILTDKLIAEGETEPSEEDKTKIKCLMNDLCKVEDGLPLGNIVTRALKNPKKFMEVVNSY